MSIAIDSFIEQISQVLSKGNNDNFQRNIKMMTSFLMNPIVGNLANSNNEFLIWKETERLIKLHFPDLHDSLKTIYLKFKQGSDISDQNKLLNVLYMIIRYKIDHTDVLSPKMFETFAHYKRSLLKSPSCNFNSPKESQTYTLSKSKSDLEQISIGHNKKDTIIIQNPKISQEMDNKFHEETLIDLDLVNELIFVMTGCDSNILKYDAVSKRHQIDNRSVFSRSHHTIIQDISKTGFLMNEINTYFETHGYEYGTIHQAFKACVTDFKIAHVDYVNKIRVQIENDQLSGVVSTWNSRKLYCCTKRSLANLSAIYRIIQMLENNQGCALLSILFLLSSHGAEHGKNFYRVIFKKCFAVFHDILLIWLNEGKLMDDHNEFFIYKNLNCPKENYWNDNFKIKNALKATFLPDEYAKKILEIGKNMYFIREICREFIFLSDYDDSLHEYFNVNKYVGNIFFTCDRFTEFYEMIDTANRISSSVLLKILMDKLKLRKHFDAMRRYMLLGQGDFTRRLVELLAPDLMMPYHQLKSVLNSSYLNNAIQSSNARDDDSDILALLEFKLLPGCDSDIGWDLFTLYYNISGPLTTIFGTHLRTYEALFRFLWRLRRMEYSLSTIWKQQINMTRLVKKFPSYVYLLQQINIVTLSLNHFTNHIQYYFLFEVLESHWKQFEREIEKSTCLDDILSCHNRALDEIKNGLFLGSDGGEFLTPFLAILNCVRDLERIQYDLFQLIETEIETYRNRQSTELLSKMKKHSIKNVIDFEHKKESISSKLRNLSFRHLISMKNFCRMLANCSNVGLQQLSFSIDFNNYYKDSPDELNTSSSFHFDVSLN